MATDSSTVIVRVIRSFPHRNIRNVVLKNVALTQTCEQFDDLVKAEIKTASLPPPFRTYQYDTFKVEHHAHGAKTNDPVINCEDDNVLILKPGQTLAEAGVNHETVLSYFNMTDYLAYKENPILQWN